MKKRHQFILVLIVAFLTFTMDNILVKAFSETNAMPLEVVSSLTLTPVPPDAGQTVTAQFAVKNIGTQTIELNRLGVGGRGPGCTNWECTDYQDFPFHQQVVILPGQIYIFSEQRQFQTAGAYFAQISYETNSGEWFFLGERLDFNVNGLQIVNELSLTPAIPYSTDAVLAEFVLQNVSDSNVITFSKIGVGVRGPNCPLFDWGCPENVDFEFEEDISLSPDEIWRSQYWRLFSESGTYFAQISVEDGLGQWYSVGSPMTFTVALSSSYPPRDSDWQFGVHFHPQWDESEDNIRLSLAKSAGVKIVRIGASWRLLEPSSKGNWSDERVLDLDRVINTANSLGMEVYIFLLEVPCWASSDPNKNCAVNQWDNAYPPTDNGDYADAFQKLIQLYGDRVKVWEVWNEPNINRFWQPSPDASAYTHLLKFTYPAIKSQDSSAIVLAGSLAGADAKFLNKMYETGAKNYFDALSLHPYSSDAPDNCSKARWTYVCGVQLIRSMMLRHKDPKDIWFTEFGWSSYTGLNGVGEIKQAEYLQEAIELLEYWDFVPVATWYNLVDTQYEVPSDRESENYAGLYDSGLRAKPAAIWLKGQFAESMFIYLPIILVGSTQSK